MKADEVGDKVQQETQEAEKKVQNTIKKVQESKLSRYLPTEIKEVKIKDIVKLLMLSIFSNFLPLYIILGGPWPKYINFLRYIFFPLFIVLFSVQVFLGIITYITCIEGLHIYLTIATVLKSALVLVLLTIIEFKFSFLQFFIIFTYLAWHTALDIAFLYYIAILLNNENSKTYDEHGVEIKKDNEKV
ncbi:hypothetical protein NAPIS_ORF01029 [Vairimorpha apis BRL 01]|uniref:Uncharacterized protein n=1 Tax=Vairimorpha apis BRL 01 TaxID=1037528 RepID=T0LAE0_9MICR|nr:hypothetical protein NAPIS_ORF01029 [Vairimorpha apis BRL 01]